MPFSWLFFPCFIHSDSSKLHHIPHIYIQPTFSPYLSINPSKSRQPYFHFFLKNNPPNPRRSLSHLNSRPQPIHPTWNILFIRIYYTNSLDLPLSNTISDPSSRSREPSSLIVTNFYPFPSPATTAITQLHTPLYIFISNNIKPANCQ